MTWTMAPVRLPSHVTTDLEKLRRDGDELEDRGEWGKDALAIYEAILKLAPGDVPASNAKGRCLIAVGRLEDAESWFEGVVATDPDNRVAVSQLDKLKKRLSALRRAEASNENGRLFKEVEEAKAKRGDLLFQVEGRRLLAREDPRNPRAVAALGAAMRRNGDSEAALQVYRYALQLDESPRSNSMAHVGLAGVLRDLGLLSEADKRLQAVLREQPDNPYALITLAAVLMDKAERGQSAALVEARNRLGRLWAHGVRDAEVQAAYRRLKALE